VTASNDGAIRLWSVSTQKLLWSPVISENRALRVQFSPNGKTIVSSGSSQALVWHPPELPDHPAPAWLAPLAKTISSPKDSSQFSQEFDADQSFIQLKQQIHSGISTNVYHYWARRRLSMPQQQDSQGSEPPQLRDISPSYRTTVERLTINELKSSLLRDPNDGWAQWFYGIHRKLDNVNNDPHADLVSAFHLDRGRQLLSSQIDDEELDRYLQHFRGLRFNGQEQYIECPFFPFDQLDAFTVEAWVWNWQGKIISEGQGGDPESSLWLASVQGSSESVIYASGWECEGANYTAAIIEADDQKWSHLAMVYNGNEQFLFLNGKITKRQESPRPGPFDPGRPLLIGAQLEPNFTFYGKGVLNSLRISSKARYEHEFIPEKQFLNDTHTELLYRFTEPDTDSVAIDHSGNDRHGKIFGASSVSW
jgi:hypothetical protein